MIKLILLLFACTFFVQSNVLQDRPDKNIPCNDKCERSYPLHTSPKTEENAACQRGCLFYTIETFIDSGERKDVNNTSIKAACVLACVDAYSETSEKSFACKAGCEAGDVLANHENESLDGSEIQLLEPLMQVRQVVSKVIGILRVVKSSVVSYFRTEDNTLVAIEGPVKIVYSVIPGLGVDQRSENSHVLKDEIVVNPPPMIARITHQTGLPSYVLILMLASLVIFMIYIIFVKIPSIGEKKNMEPVVAEPTVMPVKIVLPEDLTKLSLMDEDEGQAEPLPFKVKLPHSSV